MKKENTPADKDTALMEKAKNQDKEAFGALIDKYQQRVIGLAYKLTGNMADAEDVAQSAFIKAYKNLRRFRQDAGFSTWLYRITYNEAVSFLRKYGSRPVLGYGDEIISSDEGEGAVLKREKEDVVKEALSKLSPKLKGALVLREYEGLSYKEIAKVCRCSMGTVESRIKRARDKLREIIEPYLVSGDKV